MSESIRPYAYDVNLNTTNKTVVFTFKGNSSLIVGPVSSWVITFNLDASFSGEKINIKLTVSNIEYRGNGYCDKTALEKLVLIKDV